GDGARLRRVNTNRGNLARRQNTLKAHKSGDPASQYNDALPITRPEMPETLKLNHPWLVAVWPGMGNVAVSAGYYLFAKLEMHMIAGFEANELFDVNAVEVKQGMIQAVRRPRNQFFLRTDPNKKHDLVVFLGEAQPPIGKYRFCKRLIEYARELGVERVFTFAAMATQMHPEQRSRIFGAATDKESLQELKR